MDCNNEIGEFRKQFPFSLYERTLVLRFNEMHSTNQVRVNYSFDVLSFKTYLMFASK
jgi:hypothetical protein